MVYPDNPNAWQVEAGESGDWGQLTELLPVPSRKEGTRGLEWKKG